MCALQIILQKCRDSLRFGENTAIHLYENGLVYRKYKKPLFLNNKKTNKLSFDRQIF